MVQRVKGAQGTQQAGQVLTCTINAEFIDKHVAIDLVEAKAVTERRVATGKPLAMVNGTLANHLAPLATWTTAINAAPDVVPPEDKWNSTQGDDGPQFVDKLAKVAIVGFAARVTGGTGGAVVASAASYTGYVGGKWEVTGCEEHGRGRLELALASGARLWLRAGIAAVSRIVFDDRGSVVQVDRQIV